MTQCCRKKNVGKPCEGEPHARFDEGRMKISSAYSTVYKKSIRWDSLFRNVTIWGKSKGDDSDEKMS